MKFSENVILIDVDFINEVACHAKKFLSEKVGRELPEIDLLAWLSYIALDAGLREGDNEIQVLLLRDKNVHDLKCCEPSDLDSLDGMACRTPLGEFSFSCVTPAGIAYCEELFLDLMNLLLDSADVKRLMLVPFHSLYGHWVEEGLRKYFNGKSEEELGKAFYFITEELLQPVPCRSDSIAYSLTQALGVKSDELHQ